MTSIKHELQIIREEHDDNLLAKKVSLVNSTGVISSSNPLPVEAVVDSSVLPTGASTSALQTTGNTYLGGIAGLVPSAYDYISLTYTGSNLTGVVYKVGGSGGTTVATLTLAYSGSNLTSVTKT